jgi:ribosomal protein L11 methylase PrmA
MEFLRFLSSSPSRTVALDIGAAYGVATIAALRTGAEVIANDIDEIHLQSIGLKCVDMIPIAAILVVRR